MSQSLDSIEQRQGFASYHYHEALRIITAATSAHRDGLQMMLLIFGEDEQASRTFQSAGFQAAAHITACVQSMHTVAEMLAQSLYYAFGMNLDKKKALQPHRVGVRTVSIRLPEGVVKDLLNSLVGHDSFIYLSALTNHSKHRSMVRTNYSLDFTGEAASSHGLRFSAFEYDGERFSERWVRPTLESEYNRQATLVVEIGQALNAALNAST
ncbi:hypothetical protein [Pseudomonas sp. S3_F07]